MTSPETPLLTVVRGEPTPEQLAALVAVVLSRRSLAVSAPESAAAPPSLWAVPQLRSPVHAGPSAWRASGLPE